MRNIHGNHRDSPAMRLRNLFQMIWIGQYGKGREGQLIPQEPGSKGQFRPDARRVTLCQEERALEPRHRPEMPSSEESPPSMRWLTEASPRVRSSRLSMSVWF